MVAQGTLTPEDFKMSGQLGSRALNVLIRVQELVSARGPYAYVEIGSYLGRSLQPHVQDAACTRAVSIDLRPDVVSDERGDLDMYKGITADDMVRGLSEVCSQEQLGKLEAVTANSDALRVREGETFDLAFIDGEHTNTAVFRDFLNVLRVLSGDGVICFEDTSLVLPGILNALAVLDDRGIAHAHVFGKGNITVVALGDGSQAFVDGLGEGLTMPEARAVRRAQRRMMDIALGSVKPHQVADHSTLMPGVVRHLRNDGWTIEPALAEVGVE